MTRPGVRRALQGAGVAFVEINPKAFAVEEADLEAFLAKRPEGYTGRGRPPGAKNKPKEIKPKEIKPDAADNA